MPPMMFTSLVGLLFNLLFAGVLPAEINLGVNKLDGARVAISAPSVTP
jgi:hypothetical protein